MPALLEYPDLGNACPAGRTLTWVMPALLEVPCWKYPDLGSACLPGVCLPCGAPRLGHCQPRLITGPDEACHGPALVFMLAGPDLPGLAWPSLVSAGISWPPSLAPNWACIVSTTHSRRTSIGGAEVLSPGCCHLAHFPLRREGEWFAVQPPP